MVQHQLNLASTAITTDNTSTDNQQFVVTSEDNWTALQVNPSGDTSFGGALKGIKSTEGNKHGHKLNAQLHFEGDLVVLTTKCEECNLDLDRKVIYKTPERVRRQKCLPRMVKDICG